MDAVNKDKASTATGKSPEEFVALVGARVREARQRKAISRRILSDKSGVSQRFLAQLENTGGNVSIVLLRRIAEALDHRIEWFIGEDDPWHAETAMLMQQIRAASSAQRDQIKQILEAHEKADIPRGRICLVGLRGAGKSTLGAMLAKAVGLPFVELNRVIAREAGMPVDELIAFYGQEGYRRLEKQALEQLVNETGEMVLEAAGGIVSEAETYRYLLQHFHTVWLKASPQEHMDRVRKQGDERPMAGNPKAMDNLRSILTSRETLYAQAATMINTSAKTREQCLNELVVAITPVLR